MIILVEVIVASVMALVIYDRLSGQKESVRVVVKNDR